MTNRDDNTLPDWRKTAPTITLPVAEYEAKLAEARAEGHREALWIKDFVDTDLAALAPAPAVPAVPADVVVDDVAVQGWAAFKGHMLPTAIARHIADQVQSITALRAHPTPAPQVPPEVLRQVVEAAARDVLVERARQVAVEGWTPEHDARHTGGELARAASAYAAASTYYHADPYAAVLSVWPWERSWLKPTNPRRDLVKAGALILAEIERLDRAALAAAQPYVEGV